jgi:hypothetical protein
MRNRALNRLAVLCSGLVLFGTTMAVSSVLTAGVAGADGEIASGTHWAGTGWVQVPFYSGQGGHGIVYSWALYNGGISWQDWTYSGGGYYDKLTQDFWEGLLGTEAGANPPNGTEQADMYVTGYGATHWDGSTQISTPTGDGTCPQYAMPPYIPCEESQSNTNGHHFTNPKDNGYILYGSNYGYPPVWPNGALTLVVLNGFIS